MNKEKHLVEYKRELSETFERSAIAFLNSTGGHIYISFTDHFMRTSFYFEGLQRLGDRINDRISDRISDRIKLTETESLIYAEIKRNPSITVPLLMHETGYSEPTINRTLKSLREKSCIARVGARKNGRWEVLKQGS